jgi:hypothetical protein
MKKLTRLQLYDRIVRLFNYPYAVISNSKYTYKNRLDNLIRIYNNMVDDRDHLEIIPTPLHDIDVAKMYYKNQRQF